MRRYILDTHVLLWFLEFVAKKNDSKKKIKKNHNSFKIIEKKIVSLQISINNIYFN